MRFIINGGIVCGILYDCVSFVVCVCDWFFVRGVLPIHTMSVRFTVVHIIVAISIIPRLCKAPFICFLTAVGFSGENVKDGFNNSCIFNIRYMPKIRGKEFHLFKRSRQIVC